MLGSDWFGMETAGKILGPLNTWRLLCSISQLELILQQYKRRRYVITVDKLFIKRESEWHENQKPKYFLNTKWVNSEERKVDCVASPLHYKGMKLFSHSSFTAGKQPTIVNGSRYMSSNILDFTKNLPGFYFQVLLEELDILLKTYTV